MDRAIPTCRCSTPVAMDGVTVWYFPPACCAACTGPRRWLARLPSRSAASTSSHLHALFVWPVSAAAAAARGAGVPYVLAPRGMLEKGLFARKNRLMKSAWIAAVGRRTIEQAAALHVTSAREAAEAAAFGFALPPCLSGAERRGPGPTADGAGWRVPIGRVDRPGAALPCVPRADQLEEGARPADRGPAACPRRPARDRRQRRGRLPAGAGRGRRGRRRSRTPRVHRAGRWRRQGCAPRARASAGAALVFREFRQRGARGHVRGLPGGRHAGRGDRRRRAGQRRGRRAGRGTGGSCHRAGRADGRRADAAGHGRAGTRRRPRVHVGRDCRADGAGIPGDPAGDLGHPASPHLQRGAEHRAHARPAGVGR